MDDHERERARSLEEVARHGGLRRGVAARVAQRTGVPEAHVFGAASFYHLLADPTAELRVCTGVSCALAGADAVLEQARRLGIAARPCGCLAACDRPPAVLRGREIFPGLQPEQLERLREGHAPPPLCGTVGPTRERAEASELAIDLLAPPRPPGAAFRRARERGEQAVLDEIESSGLQGRGGAGFPAAVKWRAVRGARASRRFVVCNADEGEPGTFKDREVLLRRPDLVLEGLAIAAWCVGASEVFVYLRGEFSAPRRALERALEQAGGAWEGIEFHLHDGHGAYICGEETALLEALEGRRGMPRLKPPYPTERGLWGAPTLIHNVETIACVPAIVERSGAWFRALGRTEPGTKLYCVSGHVEHPGVYELPLGVCLDELVEAAGGYRGELLAFSPGGASSGLLPASERRRPLDFASLRAAGSMLGSAGVVVLNTETDLCDVVARQLGFFESESCGQCAPCRIGTQLLARAFDRWRRERAREALGPVADIAWEMEEGSICGLGQAAAAPLLSLLRHFPEVVER